MGTSYGTVCRNCGNEEEYMLGFGFMSNPSFEFISDSIKSKVIKRHLKVLEEQHRGQVQDVPELSLYECPECNTLHGKLQFSVIFDQNKEYSPQYKCGKCKSILIPVELIGDSFGKEMEPKGYKCKKCGKESLDRSPNILLWD